MMMEIYEALRQVTYAKAQILQQVAHSKYTFQQLASNINIENCDPMNGMLVEQQQYMQLQKNRTQETGMRLVEGLNTLKNEEHEIRQLKNRRMSERMQLLVKRKQLEVQLESLKFQTNQRNNYNNKRSPSFHQAKQQPKKSPQLDRIPSEKEMTQKQNELESIEKEIDQQKQQITKIFSAFSKLEESIQAKRVQINELKKSLENSEFKIEKSNIENGKLLKEVLSVNRSYHCRNIDSKVKSSRDTYRKLTQIYEAYIKATAKYGQTVSRIKKELQVQT